MVATGDDGSYTYTWTKGGTAVTPAVTGATLTIAAAAAGDAGVYKVTVTDGTGAHVASTECTVTVA